MTAGRDMPKEQPASGPKLSKIHDTSLRAVTMLAAAIESMLLLIAAFGGLGAPVATLLHGVVIATFGAWYWTRRSDPAIAAPGFLSLILTAVAGPFGALGALFLPLLANRSPESPELLSAWYERIALSVETDALTKRSDHIVIGRGADLGAPPPQPFAALFASGSVAARQSALGMIARHFHPDYLPMLTTALASPDAIVRVQAAAVAAKIRPELEAVVTQRLADLANAGMGTAAPLAAAADLERCAASGLLPETDAARIRAAVADAERRCLTAIEISRRKGRHASLTPGERTLLENRLLAERRFAEFNAVRLTRRDHFMRRYRWRPLAIVATAARTRVHAHARAQ